MSGESSDTNKFLTRKQFVHESGLSLATVDRYLRDGHLQKVQFAGKRSRVLIPRSELHRGQTPTSAAPPTPTENRPSQRMGPKPKWKR